MVARRYEIYLRVFKSISHEWAQRTSGISIWTPTNYDVFDVFPKISDHFPKICKMLSEGRTNVSEHFPIFSENFRRYPKNSEDCRGIDLLWLIHHWNRANLSENVSKSISSHVKITCYFHVWRYDFFRAKDFLVWCLWCLYNKIGHCLAWNWRKETIHNVRFSFKILILYFW